MKCEPGSEMENQVSNVIYGVPAQYPDPAHHGNHWNTKCIFYYLHN